MEENDILVNPEVEYTSDLTNEVMNCRSNANKLFQDGIDGFSYSKSEYIDDMVVIMKNLIDKLNTEVFDSIDNLVSDTKNVFQLVNDTDKQLSNEVK